jgi:ABC-2 type transport system permease protein
VNETRIVPPLLATPGGVRAHYALSMIGVEALFIGLFTGAQAVNERKRTGTLAVILSSPMSSWELMAADTLSALTAVGVSALALAAFSLATGAEYRVSTPSLALAVGLLVVGTLFTIGLGLLLAPLAKTPEGANVVVNAIAFPTMFVGGIVIPPFTLPAPLRAFAENWPLGASLEAARHVLLGEATAGEALASITPAVAATIAVYAAGLLVYRKLLAKTIEYY